MNHGDLHYTAYVTSSLLNRIIKTKKMRAFYQHGPLCLYLFLLLFIAHPYTITPVYSGWVVSDAPPKGFQNVVIGNRLDVYLSGVNIGTVYATVKNNHMHLSQVNLPHLTQSGLKSAHIAPLMDYLHRPNLPTNEDYISLDPHKQSLTYNDITRLVITKTIKLVLNQNNLHLYIFVNPLWIDTRIRYAPSYLPNSTTGTTFFINNTLSYSGFHTSLSRNTAINSVHNYGVSFGNTLIKSDVYFNRHNNEPTVAGINNIIATTHKNHRYYAAGTFSLPTSNTLYQPSLFGLFIEQDTATFKFQGILGTPIVLRINAPSHVIIQDRYSKKFLYSGVLYPGIQQINTEGFLSGVYPITVTITDAFGNVTVKSLIYSKNPLIPLTGHPRYSFGCGWIQKNQPQKIIGFYVPAYRLSRLTAFGNIDIATSYRSALSLGSLNYFNYIIGHARHVVYGTRYILDCSSFLSSGKSYGLDARWNYKFEQPDLNLLLQAQKTHHGTEPFALSTTYSLSGNGSYSKSWNTYGISLSLGTVLNEGASTNIFYNVEGYRFWNLWVRNHSNASFRLLLGYNKAQRMYVGLTFTYSYFHAPNHIHFGMIGANTDQLNRRGNIQWTPTLTGSTHITLPNHQLYFTGQTNYNRRAGFSLNAIYNSPLLASNTNYTYAQGTRIINADITAGIANVHGIPIFSNLGLGGQVPTGLLLQINADENVPYQILVNGQHAGTANTNTHHFITLSPFQQYNVEIIPVSIAYIAPKNNYTFTLYTGNIQYIKMHFLQEVIVLTQLIDQQGHPVKDAVHNYNTGSLAVSENDGSIQFSAVNQQKIITFTLPNNKKCTVFLPDFKGNHIFYIKTMVCQIAHDQHDSPPSQNTLLKNHTENAPQDALK